MFGHSARAHAKSLDRRLRRIEFHLGITPSGEVTRPPRLREVIDRAIGDREPTQLDGSIATQRGDFEFERGNRVDGRDEQGTNEGVGVGTGRDRSAGIGGRNAEQVVSIGDGVAEGASDGCGVGHEGPLSTGDAHATGRQGSGTGEAS